MTQTITVRYTMNGIEREAQILVKRWQKGGHDRLYAEYARDRAPIGWLDVNTGAWTKTGRVSNVPLYEAAVAAVQRVAREIRVIADAQYDVAG